MFVVSRAKKSAIVQDTELHVNGFGFVGLLLLRGLEAGRSLIE